nr:MAG TPA: hypothetical protein [Caudoviricetes sp.]
MLDSSKLSPALRVLLVSTSNAVLIEDTLSAKSLACQCELCRVS